VELFEGDNLDTTTAYFFACHDVLYLPPPLASTLNANSIGEKEDLPLRVEEDEKITISLPKSSKTSQKQEILE